MNESRIKTNTWTEVVNMYGWPVLLKPMCGKHWSLLVWSQLGSIQVGEWAVYFRTHRRWFTLAMSLCLCDVGFCFFFFPQINFNPLFDEPQIVSYICMNTFFFWFKKKKGKKVIIAERKKKSNKKQKHPPVLQKNRLAAGSIQADELLFC